MRKHRFQTIAQRSTADRGERFLRLTDPAIYGRIDMMKSQKRILHIGLLFVGSLFALLLLLPRPLIPGGNGSATAKAAESGGRVLFISSYSYAWDTVQIQIEGIQGGLGNDVVLDYEFMDTKRVDDEAAMKLFYEGLAYRMEHVEPYDVVILGDDAALVFALEHKDDIFAGIPMVFEGVNDEELAARAASDPMITGIIEKLSVEKNIEFGLKINPTATKVTAILDNTITGEAERKRFYKYAEQYPELTFGEINTSTLSSENLRKAIRNVSKDSILIYVVMTEDASGRQYTNAESVRLIAETAKVPALRMVEGGIGEGLLGGNVVSMYKSGEIAAGIALDIIAGNAVEGMGMVQDSPNVYCVDADVMEKFGISQSILPADAVILNRRQSFWERNSEVLLPGGILVVALMVIIVVVSIDNLKRKKLMNQLEAARKLMEQASQHDFLTGLPNRSKFMADLSELVNAKKPCSVIMVDIDDFKQINDVLGHTAGDEALKQVAGRLKEIGSQILTPYRFAGDEFILLLQSGQDKIIEKTGYQCRQVFTSPFLLGGKEAKICGSIGIASYPQDTEDMGQLIVYADDAMYQVKKNGKNDFAIYGRQKEKQD
ncbi:MAG: GGDEF domain-containing protein [Muribaculum sp.]|nr:GGDEF domain-containing protein [Muribaculum sp.]